VCVCLYIYIYIYIYIIYILCVCVCLYIYIYIYIYIIYILYIYIYSAADLGEKRVGLYTILPLPMLYGVWHTQGGSGGGRILRSSRAIVLQSCEPCRWRGQ